MTGMTFANVAAYSAQVMCVVALGGLLAAIIRLDTPAFRYIYWRLLLAICVALPWIQEWQVVGAPARMAAAARTAVATTAVVRALEPGLSPATGSFAMPAWPELLWAILLGGMALRLMWMAIGLVRLRRLRQLGTAAQLSSEDDALRAALAPRASIRDVDALSQPVTFGLLRPVVLLPAVLRAHDPGLRRAVLCHELQHVRRRDWLWVLLEEIVRGALWFHPAVWWLIARVQLAREEVVDDLVVQTTGARRTYVEALMLFADDAPLVPAAAFARRRHLFRRIQLIAKERAMSGKRLVLSSCVLVAALTAATWYVSRAFPLSAAAARQQVLLVPGPLEQSTPPVTLENPIPRWLTYVPPRYPADVTTENTAAIVSVKLTIDASGRVAEVRAVGVSVSSSTSGLSFAVDRDPLQPALAQIPSIVPNAHPAALRTAQAFIREATDAIGQWVYAPPAKGPVSFFAQTVFAPGAQVAAASLSASRPPVPPSSDWGGFWTSGALVNAPPPPPPPAAGARGAAAVTPSAASRQRSGGPGPGAAAIAAGTATPTAPTVAPPPPPFAPVRVGGNITAPKRIKDVKPIYPAIAQSARVQGIVILEATIDADGRVVNAKVLRSIPLLDDAAVAAVLQWEFTPTLLNGQPVPIIMSVTVNFSLAPPPEPAQEPPAQ